MASERFIKWKNFLTGADDATIANVSVFSRPAEWHAAFGGILIALDGSGTLAVALFGLLVGRTMYKTAIIEKLPDNLHWRDLVREPVYAVAGYLTLRLYLVATTDAPLLPETVVKAVTGA